MVSAYDKSGLLEFAEKFFKEMRIENVVSWNLMMSYCFKISQFREALNLFYVMCKSVANIALFTFILLFNMFYLVFECYLKIGVRCLSEYYFYFSDVHGLCCISFIGS